MCVYFHQNFGNNFFAWYCINALKKKFPDTEDFLDEVSPYTRAQDKISDFNYFGFHYD